MLRPWLIVAVPAFSLLLFCSSLARPQVDPPQAAVVTFTIDFPKSRPEHYSLRIPSDGAAHYESNGHLSPDSDITDSFDLEFKITAETRRRIFDLAAKSGYFQKDLDSHHKSLAFTGKKTLAYGDGQRSGSSTYNYSNNAAVQELTSLMQSLSATLEFGHRLQYAHRYQKLALDEELKSVDRGSSNNGSSGNDLLEVNAIQPILQQIIADPTVINVSRARAQRLLDRAAVAR
jgi:hypothetical protein